MGKNETLVLDENHVYRLMPSGTIVPGVSEIIQAVFPFEGHGLASDRAREFGTAFHIAVDLEVKRKLNWATVDEALLPYIKQWNTLVSELRIKTTQCLTEQKLFSKKYKFSGKLDLIEDVLIDYKTGGKNPTHRIQLAAYLHLWNTNNPKNKKKKAILAYFDGSESMPEIIENRPSDFSTFLACLEIYNFKKKENLK